MLTCPAGRSRRWTIPLQVSLKGEKMKINPSNIPTELKVLQQWICWKTVIRKGKPTKVPISITGNNASSTNPETWSTFENAKTFFETHEKIDGIGFVFSEKDPFCGIDLDQCVTNNVINPTATKWIDKINSYTEFSPSNTGVHIIGMAKKPGARCRTGELDWCKHVEIYDKDRFFTFTGNPANGKLKVNKCQPQLTAFYNILFPPSNSNKTQQFIALEDNAIIDKAMQAKNGMKFQALWQGDISGYVSASEADLALCVIIAFWTGNDYNRIDKIFRQSKLYRDKWLRDNYREATINKAIELCSDTYTPSNKTSRNIPVTEKTKTRPPLPNLKNIDKVSMPVFPASACQGIVATYKKALAHATEAPDEFHFACLQNIIGLAAGRGSHLFSAYNPIRPNFYTCLIAPTGQARKTTSMNLALNLLPATECGIEVTQRLATPEGLLGIMKERGHFHPKVIATLSELATLMTKAKSQTGAGLIEVITEVFDFHRTYRHPTLSNPIVVEEPFLSILAGSTQSWLEKSLSDSEVLGGFSNRWIYFTGEPKAPIPIQDNVEEINEYQEVRNTILNLALNEPLGEIRMDANAEKLWNEAYISFYNRKWKNETIASMVQRIPNYIHKTALVFAIAKFSRSITQEEMKPAIDLGNYFIQTIHYIFRLFGSDKASLQEAKIRAKLADLDGECTRRILARKLSGTVSGQDLDRALQSMFHNGEVDLWNDSESGDNRSKKMVTLLD